MCEDKLTGCFNRRKLDEDIDSEITRARRYEKVFSMLMMDVDWFKSYNDYHGHVMGDTLLGKLVSVIKGNLRDADKVYRYGGEEFVVLLPETNRDEAAVVADKLQKIIAATPFEGEQLSQPGKSITVSIGMATYPWDGNDRDELLKSVDTKLYQAKQRGRNRICGYRRPQEPGGAK